MNRRDFLLSTTGFALSPSALMAQEPPKPASDTRDSVFADFETGTYDGWTLTGNCWTPEPFSDKYFPGKITGFQGKRFLCSYHPVRGNNATGKAVSREFVIEKPFVSFLIGGGSYPTEACFNLVIDGKVRRTETGDNTAHFRSITWDLGEFAGLKAHFEVIDAISSGDAGYVMVDHITFSDPGNRASELLRQTAPRPYIFVAARFSDTLNQPVKPHADLNELLNDPEWGADRFYRVCSANRISLAGSTVAEPITLPKPRSEYLSKGEFNTAGWYSQARLLEDAGPILERTYDLTKYYGMAIFPNVNDDAGGGSGLAPKYRKRNASSAQPFPVLFICPTTCTLSVLVHEMGHQFQLSHICTANDRRLHGAGGMNCYVAVRNTGHLVMVTCDHIMWHKHGIGWTSPADVRSIETATEEVIRIHPRSGSPRGLRMVTVPLDDDGWLLTIEAVLPAGLDRPQVLKQFGILAHRVNPKRCPASNFGVWPDDIIPAAQLNDRNSIIFITGDSWTSADTSVSFRVETVTRTYCDVRVTVKQSRKTAIL